MINMDIAKDGKWVGLSLIILVFVLWRFLDSVFRAIFLRIVKQRYFVYIDGRVKDATKKKEEKANKISHLLQHDATFIKRLILEAGLNDPQSTSMEFVGYGHVAPKQYSVLDNILIANKELMGVFVQLLSRAIGFYDIKAFESINPLFWVEFIIKLPQFVFKQFKIDTSGITLKIVELLYWLVGIGVGLKALGFFK
jgi:hypothetical protein